MPRTNGRALPMCARWYTVGPQKYIRIGPGGGGSSSSRRVSVLWRRTSLAYGPAQQLVPRQRGDHGGQFRPALAPGEHEPQRLQVPAYGLQLADNRPRLDARFDELAEACHRLGRVDADVLRFQHDLRVLPRLGEVARAAQDGRKRRVDPDARRQLVVGEQGERAHREPTQARLVEVHVVLRQTQLVEVRTHGFSGDPGGAEVGDRRRAVPLGELRPVLAPQQPVVDELGRIAAERADELRLQLGVRAVVAAADDVRYLEV